MRLLLSRIYRKLPLRVASDGAPRLNRAAQIAAVALLAAGAVVGPGIWASDRVTGTAARHRDIVYGQSMFAEIFSPSVWEPYAGRKFTCNFNISDTESNYWEFTYVARLWDPNGNQIAYRSRWDSRPSFSGELIRADLTNQPSGTYRCTVDWWADESYQGQGEAEVTITFPTGETTQASNWYQGTYMMWNQTLTGGTFEGWRVWESDPGGGSDTCWFSGSSFDPGTSVTSGIGTPWEVNASNQWGPDYVGWGPSAVTYYRNQGRAPCDSTIPQDMYISGYHKYVTNTLREGLTDTTVWSERAGQYAERIWP
jgi:hypothetical protein